MLSLLREGFHDLRYNVQYAKISYRQRYYSTSHNPRVIQTRIGPEPLLSLRTYPQDKYLIKPDEFLVLERVGADRALRNQIPPLPLEMCSDNPFLDFSCLSSFHDPEVCGDLSADDDSLTFVEGDIVDTGTVLMSAASQVAKVVTPEHKFVDIPLELDVIKLAETPESTSSLKSTFVPILLNLRYRFKVLREKYQKLGVVSPSLSRVQSPLSFAEQKGENKPPTPEIESNWDGKRELKIEKRLPLYKRLGEKITDKPAQLVYSKDGNNLEVWKNLFNDVSAVAAKVSTGHQPKSRNQLRVLSSDFIGAQMLEGEHAGIRRILSDGALLTLRERKTSLSKRAPTRSYYDIISLYDDDDGLLGCGE